MEMPAEIRRAMVAHAKFCVPDEACGLLAADSSGRLCMAYCLSNAAPSPAAFTLDPGEHFRALRHAESGGWHLAGCSTPTREGRLGRRPPTWPRPSSRIGSTWW